MNGAAGPPVSGLPKYCRTCAPLCTRIADPGERAIGLSVTTTAMPGFRCIRICTARHARTSHLHSLELFRCRNAAQVLYATTEGDSPNAKTVASVTVAPLSSTTAQLPALDGKPWCAIPSLFSPALPPGSLPGASAAIRGERALTKVPEARFWTMTPDVVTGFHSCTGRTVGIVV